MGTDPYTGNRYAFTGGNPITGIELDSHPITGIELDGHLSGAQCGPDGIRCGMTDTADAVTYAEVHATATAIQQRQWRDEYQAAFEEFKRESPSAGRALEDPKTSPDLSVPYQGVVDNKFCRRAENCTEGIAYLASIHGRGIQHRHRRSCTESRHRKTGVRIELITRFQFLRHLGRGGEYLASEYVLYRGPGPRAGSTTALRAETCKR